MDTTNEQWQQIAEFLPKPKAQHWKVRAATADGRTMPKYGNATGFQPVDIYFHDSTWLYRHPPSEGLGMASIQKKLDFFENIITLNKEGTALYQN